MCLGSFTFYTKIAILLAWLEQLNVYRSNGICRDAFENQTVVRKLATVMDRAFCLILLMITITIRSMTINFVFE